MRNYCALLSRAVASPETNIAQPRALLPERARQGLARKLDRDPARRTTAEAAPALADFDAATDRIELA